EHNICWICDPDHIVLGGCSLAESRSWVSLVGLTGAMFTFSDIPQDLPGIKVEVYRKILPTIITRPLELYGMSSTPPLWCLEVNRDYDNWLVVANTSFGSDVVKRIDFSKLGLDPSEEYIVYDYWNKELVGVFKDSFICEPPDEHDADVYSIRKKRDYPWVVSVDRHISQGGVSLINLSYDDSAQTLSGISRLVPDHDCNISIYNPEGFHVDRISVNAGDCDIDLSRPDLINLNLKSADRELIDWHISFRK
ncbi:MAG: hypothetical protein KAT54_09010, partial [Candidatus Marinimicrobia bacterium]|nr:hypothetical protein [Candidatus Neomarinimicrobiota bacterium]